MKHIRVHTDRWFIGFVGIFILSQVCLGLRDTNVVKIHTALDEGISSFVNPKGYFISKIAPLFANWGSKKDISIEEKINEVFKELGVDARLVKNTIKFCNGSFEFLVYIPTYKKDFVFRYTPLINDLTRLIQKEGFRLEVRLFSGWIPITLDRLFS